MSKLLFSAGQGLATISKSNVTPDNLFQVRQTLRIHRAEMEAAEANQKLKESEERYRLVLEGANEEFGTGIAPQTRFIVMTGSGNY